MFAVKFNPDGLYSFTALQTEEYVNKIDDDIKSGNWKGYFETACEIAGTITDSMGSQSRIEIYKYCLENDIRPDESNWKYNAVTEMKNAESEMQELEAAKAAGQGMDESTYQNDKNTKLKCEYRLKNNISYDISEHNNWMYSGEFDFWSVFCTTTTLLSFIGLIVIVIGGDHISASYISVVDGKISEIPGFVYCIKSYLLSSIEIVVMSTLAFAISSVARSSALAIGISVMAYFSGSTIMLILSQLNLSWGRYLIFANVDISRILEGSPMFMGQTVSGAICVIAVHMVIFLLTAWDGFTRREA